MSISAPFVTRPVATTLLAIAIFLAGIVAYTQLPVSPLPRVDFPTIQVNASLPGASPETMASAVAMPLERRFGRIAGVTEITSSSALGSTSLTLQFDLDRDVDAAARDVQAAIAAAGGELPQNLPFRPTYRKVNPADSPIMILSLTSKSLPLPAIFDQATTILAQKIAQVEGVGQVNVGGGQQPAVRVQVDPVAIAGINLTLEDVRTAIAAATVNQPKGSLGGPSSSSVIAADDQLLGAKPMRQIVVSTAKDGTIVRLQDVADVFDDVENNRTAAWTNGTRSVVLVVRRQPGANILATNDRVRRLIPSMMSSVSPALDVEVALDRTQTIRESVRDVEETLAISVVLVIVVVYLFLRTARATLIPTVAVPLSIIGTFGVMYVADFSVDNLSLMALTISTGFVVDDAIVVTENITRVMEKGGSRLQATLVGAKQIGFTIVSITASLLAVFIPILLMGGVVGRLFREFVMTLAAAIIVSAFLSLTLTPMMCSRLLEVSHDDKPSWFHRGLERGFTGMLSLYERALDRVLAHRRLMLVVNLAAIGATVGLFMIVPKGLFPQQDAGLLMGFIEAPQDSSFLSVRDRMAGVIKILGDDPDIAHAIASVGGGFGSGAGNSGSVFIDLKPKPGRKMAADQIIARLRPKLNQLEGIQIFLQAAQDVRVGGRSARTQYQYTLQGADLTELRAWAPRVYEKLRTVSTLRDVATDQQTAGLELDVTIDRDSAARLGVTPQMIDETLYDAYGQRQIATTYQPLNQYRVVLEVKPEFQVGRESIDRLYVPTATGAAPLESLTKISSSSTALAVSHQGQFPSVTLSFNLAPNISLSDAIAQIHDAERAIGMPPSLHANFSGTAQAFQDSLSDEPILIGLALLSVYIVLGVLYESYVHPITILSTLPPAGIGALLALLLSGTEFSIIALIGMILLIGIVKKNAILMIDFALEVQREGKTPLEAIRSACLLRFRPIMMTTAAALFGALPLALGTGMGAELRRPLGITIVGGLLLSQAITLFTTPALYLMLDRLRRSNGPETAPASTDVPATEGDVRSPAE